jgi:hypothetical protein
MFYKKFENGDWIKAPKVYLPDEDKTVLSEQNKTTKNGFEWHNEDPQEYLDWEEEQKNKRNESIHNS